MKNARDDSERSSQNDLSKLSENILSSSAENLFVELRNVYFEDVIAAAFKQISLKLFVISKFLSFEYESLSLKRWLKCTFWLVVLWNRL